MILKVLLVLFLVYFLVFRFFGMLLRPFLAVLFTNQSQKYNPNEQFRGEPRQSKEGELRIDHVPNKKKKNKNFDGGEYIDYEEVK